MIQPCRSRSSARVDAAGDLILLGEQDRTRWDQEAISEGTQVLERALRRRQPGPYQVQAAIAAVHAEAESYEKTDWAQIRLLYDQLQAMAAA